MGCRCASFRSTYRDTRGQSITGGRVGGVPMYAIVCCIRAIGPIGGRPVDFISTPTTQTTGREEKRWGWSGSAIFFPLPPRFFPFFFFSFFFLFFFPPLFLQIVRVAVFFAQLSLVRDVLLLYSVTKTTTRGQLVSSSWLFFALPSSSSSRFSFPLLRLLSSLFGIGLERVSLDIQGVSKLARISIPFE